MEAGTYDSTARGQVASTAYGCFGLPLGLIVDKLKPRVAATMGGSAVVAGARSHRP
jgi:hypothetical protein